mmetsp:Transcript_36178/g.46646  ORF Transcript_36178/g.46646 Transcript_36178/m.46646 type:complete len:92 (+) Transcript_36178:48-323(+)
MPPRAIDKPPPARNPAGGAIKRRPAKTPSDGSGAVSRTSGQPGILKFYDQESPGIKMSPVQVLVISLVFIAFVVLLHIYGKFRGAVIKDDE